MWPWLCSVCRALLAVAPEDWLGVAALVASGERLCLRQLRRRLLELSP